MQLNQLKSAEGSRKTKKRLGRGIGSGLGKTSARGHKGQKARAGGYHKVGFEGGQMPLQRRLPKFGFRSHLKDLSDEVTVGQLSKLQADRIDIALLKQEGLVSKKAVKVKVILSGEATKVLHLHGLAVSAGARKAIESSGGSIATV